MRITSNPKYEHFIQILTWLQDEYLKNLNGFYGDYDVIKDAFENKKLICVIEKKEAIGYLVYRKFEKTAHISIANIKHEHKRSGVGKKLLTYFENTLIKKGIKAIDLKCSPPSSKRIWKRLGFKELKEVENHRLYNSSNSSPYLYKILVEVEKPTKSKFIKNQYIELFCKDPINKDSKPNYIWKINPQTISQKPIIYPVDSEWNVKLFNSNELLSENRIKWFRKSKFLNDNFMIIDDFF